MSQRSLEHHRSQVGESDETKLWYSHVFLCWSLVSLRFNLRLFKILVNTIKYQLPVYTSRGRTLTMLPMLLWWWSFTHEPTCLWQNAHCPWSVNLLLQLDFYFESRQVTGNAMCSVECSFLQSISMLVWVRISFWICLGDVSFRLWE